MFRKIRVQKKICQPVSVRKTTFLSHAEIIQHFRIFVRPCPLLTILWSFQICACFYLGEENIGLVKNIFDRGGIGERETLKIR